jgi:hypothetical protein
MAAIFENLAEEETVEERAKRLKDEYIARRKQTAKSIEELDKHDPRLAKSARRILFPVHSR